jgi:hypothetical protein
MMRYMKQNSLGYASKCRLYGSIQQIFAPCATTDAGPAPQEASGALAKPLLANSAYQVRIIRQAASLPSDWDDLLAGYQMPMSQAYLATLEQSAPADLGFAYLLFYRAGQAVGLASFQLMEFRAGQHLQALQQSAPAPWGRRAWQVLKRGLASRLRAKLIICGAAQFTGPYGFAFDERQVSPSRQASLLDEGIGLLAQQLSEQGWQPDGVLIKDFDQRQLDALQPRLAAQGYATCAFQPNMVLPLRPEWTSFGDYLAAMSSKYRVRARRAFKKAAQIACVELDEENIQRHLPQLHELYESVAASSEFNLINLPADYFLRLKKALPDEFRLFAYFREQTLIGFFTTLRNGADLEAHFMGFQPAENRERQLYLNMLYEIVRLAIEEEKASKISFARTAMEIKSSVGAVPEQAYCGIRHFSRSYNRIIPLLVDYLAPSSEWRQRRPFG